ncbi:hypothetical protein Tco_0308539 [Tanacetum coccineum]
MSTLVNTSSTEISVEISVVKQKHDELLKKSLLTRSQFEGQLKEKSKVISDLKVKEGKDIDTMIEMDKQIKFLNEILYKRNQSIQTIHMLAPKCATYHGRSTFANPKYLKKAQSDKPRLYEIPYDTSDPANRFCPDGEETVTLEKESRSKLDKDKVKPYDYTYQNSLYETFKPPSKAYLDQLERAKEVRKTMWRKTIMTTKAQQIALDDALVAPENRRVIGKCNMRINPGIKPKKPTYQVVLDALALTTCYLAFLITAKVPVIYMHQFWATVNKHNASYRFKINNKMFYVNVEVFKEILNICPKILEIKYITDVIVDHLHKPLRTLHQSSTNVFVESLLGTMRFVSRHEDTQVYGALLPKAMLDNIYYAIASGAEPPKSKKSQKKSDSTISSEESPSKKKPTSKPKLTKKKAQVKADKGKGLNVLSEAQIKEATKRSKKDFHISQASSSGDGTYFQSGVSNEQQRKISGTDEGTGAKPRVPDVKGNDDDEDNNDDNDDDSDDERTESDRDEIPNPNLTIEEQTEEKEEYDNERVHTPEDYELTDEENINDEEKMDEEEDDDVTKDLYKDLNVNLGNKDVEMTDAKQGGAVQSNKTEGPMQNYFVSSDFTCKLVNLENVSPADNEIASLMDTTVHREEPSSQTSSLYTVPIMTILVITSIFTTTILPSPPSFNPLSQQITSTPTPTTSETTTSFLAFLNFSSVFKFNDRVTKLETNLLEMKKVDQEKVKTQRPQVLPKVVSDFATPVIERNILIEKMEESKSHLRVDYKRELYDALVNSYNTDKDLFETYGEVFSLKRSRDEKDKYQDSSTGSDRGTKRRKSSKEAESLKDPRLKEGNSSSSSKGTSHSYHNSSGKSTHAEEPSHTVDDSGVQKNQEFDMGNTDEQPDDEAAPKKNLLLHLMSSNLD